MTDAVYLDELRTIADELISQGGDTTSLQALDVALIEIGLSVAVTSLNRTAFRSALASAYAKGATAEQVQEVVSLVSGLGVHSLMISAVDILHGTKSIEYTPLTEEQSALWDKYVAGNRFWQEFERDMPGFLTSLLRVSTNQFVGFFEYCSIPWRTQTVPAVLKELIAMGTDATPTHRFLPGFRLHLTNAIKLGASRTAIFETLELAANAPPHEGTR
jgi:alkylhydroperoxidase/carboxymuconolactone decarboxylase family protein YurZ